MRFSLQCRLSLIVTLPMLLVGCASWKEPTSTDAVFEKNLSRTIKNKKRVVLDVEFVNIAVDESDLDQTASLWQWVDESAIDAAMRRRLLDNGIRVGILANEERFRSRLADATTQQDVVEEFLSKASVASEISHGELKIPMRLGRRYELPLRQPIEGSHVALVRIDEETIGRTLSNAQYFFAITATRGNAQQQVRLRFRPEIQFGDTRQKFVSSGTAIRIDTRRDTWSIPELDLMMTASEGDTLVIAPKSPINGLARQMLTGAGPDHTRMQVVVLVRVAQVPSAVDQL
jgi:hypothetical protein